MPLVARQVPWQSDTGMTAQVSINLALSFTLLWWVLPLWQSACSCGATVRYRSRPDGASQKDERETTPLDEDSGLRYRNTQWQIVLAVKGRPKNGKWNPNRSQARCSKRGRSWALYMQRKTLRQEKAG